MELASSSSSSSSSSFLKSEPQFVYDVFINYGGEDIGRMFVSHLHSALLQSEIKTFVGEDNLQKGMKMEEHMQTIAGSKIAVIILSETYTESTWCLRELEKIIECYKTFDQIVLPVFYEIDPQDIARQKGDFGKALEEAAQKSYSGEELKHALSRWRLALTEVAGISGWDVSKFGHDAELVKDIVDRIQTLLDYKYLSTVQYPVGLESHVEKVIGCIENQSTNVCIIGIWGMGGSGKTLLAKATYNRIYRTFIGKCFIPNVRKVSHYLIRKGKKPNVNLQEKLLYDVLKFKFEMKQDAEKRKSIIKDKLSRKKLLIVLDDVNEFGQLEDICGNREWFGQGTVIIITTRNVRLLNQLKVNYVYKMDDMTDNDSLKLLRWHAFGEGKVREDFNELERNVVSYSGGLPLALEVLGSYLSERTKKEWESVLSKLKLIPNDQVQEKLRISFDGLRYDMEKNIFLDVCCFFIGEDRGYVTEILNGCGLHADMGITVLIESSLLKVDKNNKLQMHPLLRDMGREIIRERSPVNLGNRSRLWFHDDVKGVLTKNTGTEATEGLSLKLPLTIRDRFEVHAFEKMERLRLLQLDHVQVAGSYEYFPKQLRWICWARFPSKYIPNNFNMENVIALDLKHSHLRIVWKQSQVLSSLKFLDLSHSHFLMETPDFSGLPSLEELILKDCPSLCKIHQSIGDLCNLLLINLKDCTSLSNLPREIYKLKSLNTLILSGCLKIDILEEDIEQMESLITLIAENKAVKQVPFSIVSSKSIGYISLRGFERLSDNIFPSIIRSWMPPTINPLSFIHPSCMGNNWRDLAPLFSDLGNLRSVLVQCDTEFQLSTQVQTIRVEYGVNYTELRISEHHLRFSLIGVGSYDKFFNTLNKSISEGLARSECCDICLPGDNHPYWLGHVGEGHSVFFTVPQDCHVKGMALCVVYSSTPDIMATECLKSVLIVNYTKFTFQIHKHGTIITDMDWEGIISNLGSGDKVEIFVTFGQGLVVKKTAVYLIYGESNDFEMEPCCEQKNALYKFIKKIVVCDCW